MTHLERIAAFVCGSDMASMPAVHRARLRLHAADAGVALVAAARSPEGRHLRALARGRGDIEGTAGLATALIRTAETDDIHLGSCVTPTSVALPAAALTGAREATTVENALRVCVELAVRLGRAIDGPSALYRGVWPTCFAAPFAVAAAIARVRGLNERETTHALSLSLMMSSGRGGRFGGEPSGRWVLLMGAVADGARAVDAAAHGFQGDPALLDGTWLKNAVGVEADVGALVDDLSRPIAWEGLGMKPFSTARQALAPVQALNELIAEGLDPACIDTVEVFAPQAFAAMISRPLEPLRSSGYVHVGFQMALAALKPSALLDLDRSDVMTDRTLRAFADRVRVVADPALDALYPEAWAAEICVCAGGRELRRRVDVAHGDASDPLSADEVRAKSRSLLRPLMSAAEAEATIAVFENAFEADNAFATAAFCMREALAQPPSG